MGMDNRYGSGHRHDELVRVGAVSVCRGMNDRKGERKGTMGTCSGDGQEHIQWGWTKVWAVGWQGDVVGNRGGQQGWVRVRRGQWQWNDRRERRHEKNEGRHARGIGEDGMVWDRMKWGVMGWG